MISIKAAVIAATAVGAVAVGGVTWASVVQPQAAPRSAQDRLQSTVDQTRQKAPKTLPTCVPASELAKKGTDAVREHAPGVPNAELPPCPDARTLPKPDGKIPSAPQVPAAPQVPEVPGLNGLSCDKLAPAIEVGSTLERTVMVSKGLKYATGKTAVRDLGAAKACAVTQKWVSKTAVPGWVTVERIQTPARTSERQLREELNFPASAVRSTSATGVIILRAPAGQSGVLVIDPAGYAVLVNGNPVAATSLQDVAAALAKVRG